MKLRLAFLVVAFSGAASAQMGEFWFSAGESIFANPNLGSPFQAPVGLPNDFQLGDGFRFGFRFCFNNQSHFGHEIQYAYSRTSLKDNAVSPPTSAGFAVHTGGYNFLYYLNKEGSRIRPFATAGIHFSNFVPPGASAASGGGENKFGFNYGVGVKARVGSKFAVRADFRAYETGHPFGLAVSPSGLLTQIEASAGFGMVF